ncbi:type II toxin-antitoxin system YafQ family toxin [Pectinatus haikarae]|uniref:mRNA interferase YafQ n=1 Tax=Pectinatus haikarae TaxID=349096 RepID=A0ABT9Y563_9FIRM|nr:type II toxin-antitoxin system YafQ family toxin [Pectinatus haikarae]MDQ0202869.1 mRNA interferase YafQ [Pectinatus haikarae]
MYKIVSSSRFKKDLKIAIKRGYNMELMESIVNQLSNNKKLPPKNKDHVLIGDYGGCRECHITPDWILIYEVENDELILYLTRTGTHSDLF